METITTLTINGSQYRLTDAVSRQAVEQMQQSLLEQSAALEAWQQELQLQQAAYLEQLQQAMADVAPPVVCRASGKALWLKDAADRRLRGLTLCGEAAGTENAEIAVVGKNLLPYPYTDKTVTRNGVTFAVAEDGSITVSTGSEGSTNITKFAIAAKNTSQALPIPLPTGWIPGEKYTLSGGPFLSGVMLQLYFYKENGDAITHATLDSEGSKSFTIPANAAGWYCCIRVANKTVIPSLRITAMVEKGSEATQWAPYTGQFLSVPGLEAGDVLDFAKGVLVRSDGSETPLDAQLLASFAALHTNCPDTGIFNDAGGNMEVTYVADTKTYIDRKEDA